MNPELKVFLFAAAMIAFAYTALYPRLKEKTLGRMVRLDLALTAVLIIAVGAVYYGSGTAFSLLVITVPWWLFALLGAMIVELPFFYWFCKRWDIDLTPPTE
jgi:hypothetical protein